MSTSLPKLISEDIKLGKELAGNNLDEIQLKKWYQQEQEAYFESNNTGYDEDSWYSYMRYTNNRIFFSKLNPNISTGNITFFGPARGTEAKNIQSISEDWSYNFIESSDSFREILESEFKNPNIIEPNIYGKVNLDDNSQDVVCAFSTLHHIANISDLLQEIHRILKPNGYLFIREPCAFMGDWRYTRKATPNERGISKLFLLKTANEIGYVLDSNPIPICYEPINKTFVKFNIWKFVSNNLLFYIDRLVSKILSYNDYYWRDSFLKKLGPSSYSYIFRK
jgi:SAM-dependent methyltransferase